ncbi:Holliday junction ATP-dependent DNA helicase RuvA [Urinicoccus massiliensis]|uniref:Holliday junction branch migration complex subunit RuvA n=1 Tax=Urinicoccus massiliensis TaxID=1723382 RepID=A0A8H2QRY1_9FIRM|nr:Holliday junction branch migration protein RuvA [Urinicoccus massiliensis]VFB16316.1 Holliday junction ATP-dependent DNA helicase RuvA [Urinicoccus massiliensis]
MIDYIKGSIYQITNDAVVIDKGGIGIKILMPSTSLKKLSEGQETTIYTDLVVREDDISLYGFIDLHERQMYQLLITVSGIGPKVAMNILGGMNSSLLQKSILLEDLSILTQAPGVGKKTAQRIVVELKDKLSKMDSFVPSDVEVQQIHSLDNPALEALIQLGYQEKEANKMLQGIDKDQPIELILRQALKNR